MFGHIAFVLSPQACTQMSVTCVELIQVTNALRARVYSPQPLRAQTKTSSSSPHKSSTHGKWTH